MTKLTRPAIAAASLGLTMLGVPVAASATEQNRTTSSADSVVASLIRLSAESNAALMRGDIKKYVELVGYTDDFTLMSPFGGTPSRAVDYTSERVAAMGRFFRNGTFRQEVVQAYGSPDMVVLALIERANVEVGGLPAQEWALRVTLVYRREGEKWTLAHRHADPLVDDVSHEQAASLARGERNQSSRK